MVRSQRRTVRRQENDKALRVNREICLAVKEPTDIPKGVLKTMFTSSKNTRRKFGLLSRFVASIIMAAFTICGLPMKGKAAPVNTPLTVSFYTLHCVDDTVEANDDEPYVVFFTANLKSGIVATTDARRSTLFGGVEAGDDRFEQTLDFSKNPIVDVHPVMLWGIKGKPAPILDPNDIIILVGVM